MIKQFSELNFERERQVERHYLVELENSLGILARHINDTDGLLSYKSNTGLFEFKLAKKDGVVKCDLSLIKDRASCILQVLFYLKDLTKKLIIPNIIIIATEELYSIFERNILDEYLTEDIDWSVSASFAYTNAHTIFYKITRKLMDDKNIINLPIFYEDTRINILKAMKTITPSFNNMKFEIKDMKDMIKLFDNFISRKIFIKPQEISDNEMVSIFNGIMTGEFSPQEGNPNRLTTSLSGKSFIPIDGSKFKSFINSVMLIKNVELKEKLISESDRLIKEITRRYKGEFYTPDIWVDHCHSIITDVFTDEWYNWATWDCASGLCNLTRKYESYFKELYSSTINQSDIDLVKLLEYNKPSIQFQYDFLNDDVEDPSLTSDITLKDDIFYKLKQFAPNLFLALKNNYPINFFINPPYASAGTMKLDGSYKGKGTENRVSETKVNSIMLKNKLGLAAQQLYCQFLYRIILLKEYFKHKNINIIQFSPPLFLTGPSFKNFRKLFFKHFSFEKGILFNASEFGDVKGNWGISFTIFSSRISEYKNNFKLEVKENIDEKIETVGEKIIFNCDTEISLSQWIREFNTDTGDHGPLPCFKSGLKLADENHPWAYKNSLINHYGIFICNGNNVYENTSKVCLMNGLMLNGAGWVPITEKNIDIVIAAFTARKAIYSNWINQKDEYFKPTIKNKEEYIQWLNNSFIYTIFNSSNNLTGMRNVIFKGKPYTYINNFFWLSNDIMKNLSIEYNFDEMYKDCNNFKSERFIYSIIKNLTISEDAKIIFELANNLLIDSFKYRKEVSILNPEWHLNAWDAGWYQIKLILKQKMPKELKEFNEKYKIFEDKMREGVYKFEFLRN
jgi:hypothetical protein